ncbi:hypothetical protein B0A55_09639 [Friedmanniomyces simplex]|uniref:G domain-containing protein n=1 Tax=Friedmanniomyces simplex TaxID=329884 RepID=A0A4U0WTH8_9PEZI|nr:hypothetical protein B0A55_09639 [Friedmanniomyces simplex]
MALPPTDDVDMKNRPSSPAILGKRKREYDADSDDDNAEDTLFIPDENDMSLVVYGTKFAEHDDILHADSEDEDEEDVINDEESADEALDDDEDDEEMHMESSEPFPDCAIYDEAIPAITARLTDIPKKVVAVLQPHSHGGKHVTTHLNAANALIKVPATKRLRVALIGNAGVGKSSTLNAITDIANLAKSLASGMSCTNLPTEYRNPFTGQIKPYAAIIRYYDSNGIRRLLVEYTKDFYLYEFELDEDWDEETCQMFHKRSKTALNTLQMLFRDLKEFSTREAARQYLRKSYKDPSRKTLEFMHEACRKMLRSKMIIDGAYSESYQAPSLGRLRKLIDPVMGSKSSSDEPALWPLVKHISIGVRGSRVLDAMTIIDLPGSSDNNESRIELVKEYVKTCDYIWVVAPISRVIDDGTTFNMVHRYGKLFRGRIMVVTTHSDADIDSKLVTHLRDEGLDMQGYYYLNNVCKDEVKKIKHLEKGIKQARGRKSRQTKSKLLDTQDKDEEVDGMKKLLKSLELRRFDFVVQARNQYVTQQLRLMLEDHLPENATLAVYCISNSHYAAIKTGRSVRGSRLSPEGTGVPALRAYALALPAPGLLQTLEQYCSEDLNVFFKNAQLWVKTTHLDCRAELLELAQVPLKKLEGRVESRVAAFKDGIKSGLVNALHKQFATTRDTAIKVLDQKRKKHSATIRAFIRKNGNHSTQMCPKESWNEQFVKGITEFIDQHWEAFENSRTQITDQLKDVLIQDMRNILPDIARDHPLSSKALPTLRLAELVEAQVSALNNVFRNNLYPYSQDLRNIRMDVTQDSSKNYFSRTILPVYEECSLEFGQGVTKRCLARIEAHLTKSQSESPFTKVERSLTHALIKNDAKHTSAGKESVKKRVQAIFKSLYSSFDRLIDKTVENPQERVAREALQEVLGDLEEEYRVATDILRETKGKYAA